MAVEELPNKPISPKVQDSQGNGCISVTESN